MSFGEILLRARSYHSHSAVFDSSITILILHSQTVFDTMQCLKKNTAAFEMAVRDTKAIQPILASHILAHHITQYRAYGHMSCVFAAV